jgi:hypothetical protein
MTRTLRSLAWLLAATSVLTLSGCDSGPNPNARKVISACFAVGGAEASVILGGTLVANKMSGDDAPHSICSYVDEKNEGVGLLNVQKADGIKDPVADMAGEEQIVRKLMNGIVRPAVTHPADGFAPGSFYANISPTPGVTSVRLVTIQDGYKLVVVVNNPKDFAAGEQQAAAIAHKVHDNILNGNAFATL